MSAAKAMPKGPSTRLDVLVAERAGTSRARAQALILEGRVRLAGEPHTKAGELVPRSAPLDVAAGPRFVSRGGVKLEQALDAFGWSPRRLRCLDVGASTGGFTDCLLQRGAAHVTALDVGYGQLAWSLRQDPRVAVIERCNFRHAAPDVCGAPFDFITADVSFISLTKLVGQFERFLAGGGRLVLLIKPQFEAGSKAVGRRGVVRDEATQVAAIETVTEAFLRGGLPAQCLTHSPITGPEGNVEFLLGAIKGGDPVRLDASTIVRRARRELVAGVPRRPPSDDGTRAR